MKNSDIIQLEALGDFPFTFYIEKAVPVEEDDELIIEGIASTTNVDHDRERMSKDALRAMEAAINKDGVPLRVEHQKDGEAIIGRVYKGWVDERNQLHIRARLDKNHPVSPILHHSMKSGTKMGLSVGGVVKRAMKEFVESVGGLVKTFYDVQLQEVSVTPRPANYDSWLVAKSIAKDTKEAEEYSENESLKREFLFENSQLDYLQAFAKSVPDSAWRKVVSPIINKDSKNMDKEITKEKEDDETEKSVTRSEFNSLTKAFKELGNMVSKGFENVGAILSKAMDGSAKDTTSPDKEKPKDESPAAKAMDSDAKDQNAPDKDKPKDESPTAKSEDDKDTDDQKKKSSEKDDETTKADKEETYEMETVTRAIETLQALQKRLTGTKKTSSEKEEETEKAEDEEETEKSQHHPLDVFVATVTKMMEAVVEKFEKSGKRVLGFEKSFIEDIQNNPTMQAELTKLLKLPGFKKSVALGVPYMVTKDGKRFPLQVVAEKVEKSSDEKPVKDFKTLYKTKFSSVREDAQE